MAKVDDFNQAALEYQEGAEQGVMVLGVPEHKTSQQGLARLTVGLEDYPRIQAYVDHMRPLMDPAGESNILLIMPGPRPLGNNLHHYINRFGDYYVFKVPTATELQKAIATTAARECSPDEITLLSNQMSHSVETHHRYYEQLKGKKHTARAHHTVERLTEPQQKAPPPQKAKRKVSSRKYFMQEEKAIRAADP